MPSPDESIGFLLNDVARLLRHTFNRRVQHLGLAQSQWRALGYIAKREGLNQVTLADQLEIQPITLARLIDRLEQLGLVERRPDPADRRASRLYLTPKAGPLIEQLSHAAADVRKIAFGKMPAESRNALMVALNTMKINLADADDAALPGERKSEDKNGSGRRTRAG